MFAISLDKNLPDAKVDAWDISEEALAIARKNNEELDAQVTFRRQDVFSADGIQGASYDIIVSNPPYVTETEKTEMEANVLDWEPNLPCLFLMKTLCVSIAGLRNWDENYFVRVANSILKSIRHTDKT